MSGENVVQLWKNETRGILQHTLSLFFLLLTTYLFFTKFVSGLSPPPSATTQMIVTTFSFP